MMFLAHSLLSIGSMIIFAYLSVHFNKWWIILFSFVVMSVSYTSEKSKDNTKDDEDKNNIE